MECPWGVPTISNVLRKSVEQFERSGVGFGGVDPQVLFNLRAQVTPVWPVQTPVEFFPGEHLGEFVVVPCSCCFEFGSVWSSVGLFGRFGVSWLEPVWPVGYTGLTGVGAFCRSSQVSPAGTGLAGGAHRPDRCRSVWLEWCSAAFLGPWGWLLVPRASSIPVAAWSWPTWVVSRRRVLEDVFSLLEPLSPSRRIFIGCHSLRPPSSLVRRIGPSRSRLARTSSTRWGSWTFLLLSRCMSNQSKE
jgi:hypothetical protein